MDLKRDMRNKMIAGVCAGIANKFEIDPFLIRLGFVLAVIFGFGVSILIYLLLWILVPAE